jgi:predicted phage replisome organizer
MAEIKWIKITTDIFDDEKIRIIEKMPEGDTMLVIWLKVLTLAGKKNDHGYIYFTKEIPYTPEILSDIFNRDQRLISLALNTFVSFGMIEIENDIISVLNWEKHQNIEGMDKIREQNRVRNINYRQRKKLQTSNVTVTPHDGTDKIRIDKIRIEEEEKKYNPAGDLVFFKDSDFQEVWKDFMTVRSKKKAAKSDRAIKSLILKLLEFSSGDKQTAIKIIGKSADSGWSNIYALKTTKTEKKEETVEEIFKRLNLT